MHASCRVGAERGSESCMRKQGSSEEIQAGGAPNLGPLRDDVIDLGLIGCTQLALVVHRGHFQKGFLFGDSERREIQKLTSQI